MLTIDRVPLRCVTCGTVDLEPAGADYDLPALELLECACGARWKLHTLITRQAEAPARKRVRDVDPVPSQQAARLDFGDQQTAVCDALARLGLATADEVTAAMQADGVDIQRSVVSKRLGELVATGAACKDGTRINDKNRPVTVYRVTQITRRQAA